MCVMGEVTWCDCAPPDASRSHSTVWMAVVFSLPAWLVTCTGSQIAIMCWVWRSTDMVPPGEYIVMQKHRIASYRCDWFVFHPEALVRLYFELYRETYRWLFLPAAVAGAASMVVACVILDCDCCHDYDDCHTTVASIWME